MRFVADGYQVLLRDDAVLVADADGRAWSRLSMLASVHRVDVLDESYDLGELQVTERDDAVEVSLTCACSAWAAKTVLLRCLPDRLEYAVRVTGVGTLANVQLLGGRALLPSGACGVFRSSTEFASVFDPTPTEPIQVVRSAATAATLGVVGDASPGRLHGIFAPPPLCLAFGRATPGDPTAVPGGDWLSIGVVAGVDQLRFTEMRYAPEDDGFLLELDYDGHTSVHGEFRTPTLVLRPAADPWQALATYRTDLVSRGLAPTGPVSPVADWWREPIFCGWGAQVAARDRPAAELSRHDCYDEWLATLAEHGIVPGTVVIDDQWEAVYGSGEPHPDRWPQLREWIAARHAAGQRVLLWWKTWDAAALRPEQCVVTPSGAPLAADPASPAYLSHLTEVVARLLRPDGLDADGFKVDFLQCSPAGHSLRRPGAPADAPWGIALLHALLTALYAASKAAKPDALVITHTPHPAFGDVTDMVRLNDILGTSPTGARVPPIAQLAFRHAVVAASMPDHLIDTDQWPIATRDEWRAYVAEQGRRGVPSLYYVAGLDQPDEVLDADDLALVAAAWRKYRSGVP
ncbi:MAG TPA: hypothetical protein VE442_20610 [Jatrophihabitans sp.]|jgi:hypothetical protein|nr:hypothetical protein [Jatrophihabitans sp.]